jgi:3-methyladenine DNA glycosylase AlkD
MTTTAEQIKHDLFAMQDKGKEAFFSHFFKTEIGQYGFGDKFIGVTVPKQRSLIKKHKLLELTEIQQLLNDEYHECRFTALLFLIEMFKQNSQKPASQTKVYEFYCSNFERINNWDLVDLSAAEIVGAYLFDKERYPLQRFAISNHLWTQRIAIVSTAFFIRNEQLDDTFKIAEILLNHPHDLIHKAVGWQLREAGKRNSEAEINFLLTEDRYKRMPRTMLRYAIEKFPATLRKDFLNGII